MIEELKDLYSVLRGADALIHENLERLDEEKRKELLEQLNGVIELLGRDPLELSELRARIGKIWEIAVSVVENYDSRREEERKTEILRNLAVELEDKEEDEKIVEIKNRLESLAKALILAVKE